MFAVIFEVTPKPDQWDDYLAIAGSLRPELENIDGFVANERYTSRRREGRVLSLSIWRDEKAVIRWRTLARHHHAQARGRSEIFEDYHLRVGEVVADNRLPTGQSLLQQRFDVTEIGVAKLVTITELGADDPASNDLAAQLRLPQAPTAEISDHEDFVGINDPKHRCCWFPGRTRRLAWFGSHRCTRLTCATARSASSGTTACTIAVRPRNTIRRPPTRVAREFRCRRFIDEIAWLCYRQQHEKRRCDFASDPRGPRVGPSGA